MKPEHKALVRQILIVLSIGLVAFVVWEVLKAFKAGERTVAGILMAPFTAAKAIWKGIENLFTGSGSSGSAGAQDALNSLTAGINDPLTGQPINDQTALQNFLLGFSPAPASANVIDFSTYPAS